MLLPLESIQTKIIVLRGQKVILDKDLAELYSVSTKSLKQAVRRNSDRFPEDFMLELTDEEMNSLRSQNVTLDAEQKKGRGGYSKYNAFAFTEYGCLQVANVLRSDTAKEMSIAIIRVFTQMRQMLTTHEQLKKLILEHEDEIRKIWFELEKLGFEDDREKRSVIGFAPDHDR